MSDLPTLRPLPQLSNVLFFSVCLPFIFLCLFCPARNSGFYHFIFFCCHRHFPLFKRRCSESFFFFISVVWILSAQKPIHTISIFRFSIGAHYIYIDKKIHHKQSIWTRSTGWYDWFSKFSLFIINSMDNMVVRFRDFVVQIRSAFSFPKFHYAQFFRPQIWELKRDFN